MTKLLIVDDEAGIRQIIKKYAQFEGYEVAEAANGMEAIDYCRENADVDLIVMDIMMPELDGFSACREIRKMRDVPVLMLSARGEEYDRIHGFEAGGDDYVVKPFSPRELMLRIDAILRRAGSAAKPDEAQGQDGHEVLQIGGLCIDFSARLVYVDGERRNMSPKEYELLFYLVQNRGRALTREKIITEIWGYDYYGDDRTLDTHIKLLRKSLGKYAACIVTLRGVGYRFEAKEDLEER